MAKPANDQRKTSLSTLRNVRSLPTASKGNERHNAWIYLTRFYLLFCCCCKQTPPHPIASMLSLERSSRSIRPIVHEAAYNSYSSSRRQMSRLAMSISSGLTIKIKINKFTSRSAIAAQTPHRECFAHFLENSMYNVNAYDSTVISGRSGHKYL